MQIFGLPRTLLLVVPCKIKEMLRDAESKHPTNPNPNPVSVLTRKYFTWFSSKKTEVFSYFVTVRIGCYRHGPTACSSLLKASASPASIVGINCLSLLHAEAIANYGRLHVVM